MKKIIVVSLFFLLNCFSFGQDQIKSSFWAEVGTGVSFVKLSAARAGINIFASLNYESQNNNYSLSYLRSSEITLFTHPDEFVKSYELKYGRSIDFSMKGLLLPFPFLLIIKKEFNYSLIGKIGISYNEARERTNLIKSEICNNSYNSKLISGIGLPIEIELREEITDFIGMSLAAYANFNKVKNYSGINFNISVGKFYRQTN
jgi:hypothetical protein